MKKVVSLVSLLLVLIACKETPKGETSITSEEVEKKEVISNSKADIIINEAIAAHGGELYDLADYSFTFRNKEYRVTHNKNQYTYSVNSAENVLDIITNGEFKRLKNKEEITLSEEEVNKYSNALNSVIYFATLPYKLNDAAVHKKFIETIAIKGSDYDVIEVTFGEEGGGEDHDDIFYYWINRTSKKMNYLAYSYKVNEGGVRFRSAYNSRVIGGVTFQDYINWKADLGTPLKDLANLYEQNKLEKLSRILTENIIDKKRIKQ